MTADFARICIKSGAYKAVTSMLHKNYILTAYALQKFHYFDKVDQRNIWQARVPRLAIESVFREPLLIAIHNLSLK